MKNLYQNNDLQDTSEIYIPTSSDDGYALGIERSFEFLRAC